MLGAYPTNWPEMAVRAAGAPVFDAKWAILCALSMLPIAAILHHAVFYPAQCMLNGFGPEYQMAAVKLWLATDPSLLGAGLIATGLYYLGFRSPGLRCAVPAFLLAFLPLCIWIWDIPFTGRWICEHLHDLRFQLPGDVPLRGRHFYLVGVMLFPPVYLLMRRRSPSQSVAALRGLRAQQA